MMSVHEVAHLNARLPLRPDWRRALCRIAANADDNGLARFLAEFAQSHAIGGHGLLTPALRRALVRQFPELGIRLLGPHLSPRFLLGTANEMCLYDRCEAIVQAHDGLTFATPFVPQILALRGCRLGPSGDIFQTDSAQRFAAMPYGARDHFSSQKNLWCDTIFVLFWRDPQKHARIFEGTSNPNSVWPEGTAHLCDGQYTFRLGRHRTFSRPHIDAVLERREIWPSEWIFEHDEEHVRYIALEGVSPVHVVRGSGEALDLSEEDILRAETGFSEFDPKYTDTQRIKINIHTCPADAASSLGCQNIHPDQYADFIARLTRLEASSRQAYGFVAETWYMLLDASKV